VIRRAALIVAGTTAAATLAAPGVASAHDVSHDPLDKAKAAGYRAVDIRLRDLRGDLGQLARARHLRPADRTALTKTVTADIEALTEMREKIAGETTAAAVQADIKTVQITYRVYWLVQPVLHDVIVADRIDGLAQTVIARADALHAKLVKAGTLTTAENNALVTAKNQAVIAQNDVHGEVEAVLALTPAMVSDKLHPAALDQAKADNKAARKALANAASALHTATWLSAHPS
jgi:hypothetical protein